MHIRLALLLLPLMAAPAFALEPQLADGDWDCAVDLEILGGINIDGESYRFTRPDGRKRGGDLALELDGVTYAIESGVLRDEFGLTQIQFDDEGGRPTLTLSSGDLPHIETEGACLRPLP